MSKYPIIHFNVWVILMQSHNVLLSCPQLPNSIVIFFHHLHLIALLLLLAMIWTFFLEHQIYTVFFCTLTQLPAQFFSLKTTSFNFLKASISKLKYLYLFARLNPENTVYLCFHVIYDVVVKSPNTVSFRAKRKILYKQLY